MGSCPNELQLKANHSESWSRISTISSESNCTMECSNTKTNDFFINEQQQYFETEKQHSQITVENGETQSRNTSSVNRVQLKVETTGHVPQTTMRSVEFEASGESSAEKHPKYFNTIHPNSQNMESDSSTMELQSLNASVNKECSYQHTGCSENGELNFNSFVADMLQKEKPEISTYISSPSIPAEKENLKQTPEIQASPPKLCRYCRTFGTVRQCDSGKTLVTKCEVRTHTTTQSCWIVAKENVYDVTTYLEDHPGGRRCLLKRAITGKDCSEDLQFHSQHGKKIWQKYKVGKVVSCEEAHQTTPGDCVII